MYSRWKFVAYAPYKDIPQICAQQCKNNHIEQAHAVDGGFNGQPQRKYDPFSNTYNPGWRDHPNLHYGNPPQQGN